MAHNSSYLNLKVDKGMKRYAKAGIQWDTLHNFEYKQKELFLKKLTANESLKILKNLYQFAQKINDRAYYKNLNLTKIHTLSKVHFMFMRVNL